MDAKTEKSNLIEGATGPWEVIIGMEVHAQVTSKSKLFSGASTEFGGEPNSHVSLVDAAMPGMLPVINEECVAQAVRTGLGLKARINLSSVFDRKNYFYPDLPQGYQISQYKSPVVGEGEVIVDLLGGERVVVGIERLHLDRGYGYPSLPDKLTRHQINDVIVTMRKMPGRGRVSLVGLKRRWPVERTNAWLTNFRQLKINWDRTIEHRLAALQFGLAILMLYRIVDHLNANHLPLDTIR